MVVMLTVSAHAAPAALTDSDEPAAATMATATANQPATSGEVTKNSALTTTNTLAKQLQPSTKALSAANQKLLSRNAQLQRQVNDLQTQVNVLIYESKGQLFLYGALTVLISLLVGVFLSWLMFGRRARW